MTWEIVSGVLVLIGIVLTVKWQVTKLLLKDTAEVLTCISDALEDNHITKEEAQAILRECSEVVADAKKLIGR